MTPSPNWRHQRISQLIGYQLERELENCESCRALLPVDWKVNDDTVLQPDNLVVCYQPTGDFLSKAPTLIFEVLSPSTGNKDKTTKYSIYEREGVEFYCIVDPLDQRASIFRLSDGKYCNVLDTQNETFRFDVGGCRIDFDFSKIWDI